MGDGKNWALRKRLKLRTRIDCKNCEERKRGESMEKSDAGDAQGERRAQQHHLGGKGIEEKGSIHLRHTGSRKVKLDPCTSKNQIKRRAKMLPRAGREEEMEGLAPYKKNPLDEGHIPESN